MNPVISRVLSFIGGSFQFKGKRNLLYQVSLWELAVFLCLEKLMVGSDDIKVL